MTRRVSLVKNLDWWTVFMYVLLVFMGWVNIYAAVYNEEHQSILDISQRYGKQLMWIGAAFFLSFVILLIDGKFFSAFAYPVYFFMIVLLIAVLIFGREVNGARSWFQLGSIRLQPAEFAKFATCLAISRYISQFNFKIHKFKSLLVAGIILFTPAVLIILQRDAGSALVYSVFVLVLYREGLSGVVLFVGLLSAILFIATLLLPKLQVILLIIAFAFVCLKFVDLRFKQIGIGLLSIALCFAFIWGIEMLFQWNISIYAMVLVSLAVNLIPFLFYIYKERLRKAGWVFLIALGSLFFSFSVGYLFENVLESHQQERINDLLGIESDPSGAGYNVAQSKIAIGSGGFSGKGFLNGTQTKFKFVPEQSTDFIFCTVGEEWGFLGSTFVLFLILSLIIRLLFLAERQRTPFSRIYGYGVACILFFHLAINVGMTIGLAPVIGIPLPFFSYGGSSLWSFTILLFIFLRLDANRLELLR
ncbi:rod shape-determining protein RodA [Labilibaculum sp.]|uniref:rod shape-determining protein RodA n=1 Tax=Labilibaculum sp. TaxID=2060723 RepID=UPI00356A1410